MIEWVNQNQPEPKAPEKKPVAKKKAPAKKKTTK